MADGRNFGHDVVCLLLEELLVVLLALGCESSKIFLAAKDIQIIRRNT